VISLQWQVEFLIKNCEAVTKLKFKENGNKDSTKLNIKHQVIYYN